MLRCRDFPVIAALLPFPSGGSDVVQRQTEQTVEKAHRRLTAAASNRVTVDRGDTEACSTMSLGYEDRSHS